MPIIDSNLIAFDVAAASKEDAVRLAGGMLVKAGRVLPPYVDSMLEKEISDNCTYLGEGVAMPHSMESGRAHILQAGLCMLRLAQGVPWGDDGEDARLVFAIAAQDSEHKQVMARLCDVLMDEDRLAELLATTDPQVVLDLLGVSQPS